MQPAFHTQRDERRRILTGADAQRAWRERKQHKLQNAKRLEHPGRPMGAVHGTWVTDIAELMQAVVLCTFCWKKFDPKRYGYYRTREFKIRGKCDACKQYESDAKLFVHEKSLGRGRHNTSWWPR